MRNPMGVVRVLALVGAVGSGAAFAATSFQTESDSGIDGPPYDQILRAEDALVAQHPGWITQTDYGRTARGRTLRALRIQNPAATPGATHPAVLLSGATHGDEYLGIEDRFAAWFLENRETSPGLMRFLNGGGVIYLIPIVNPDGYEADTRGNSRGTDLNRDFDLIPAGEHNFTEPETRTLADWLDQDLTATNGQLKLTVDYHCCTGALLFPWAYADTALPAEAQRGHAEIAALMREDIDASYDSGNTSSVLGYYGNGTSKDYYYAKYNALAFTFEGAYREEAGKFLQHTVWWDHILARLAP